MTKKYCFGTPFDTEAAVLSLPDEKGLPEGFETTAGEQIVMHRSLQVDTVIYGLGENVRGINKRSYRYVSFCTDIPGHSETTESLYAAHNFLIFKENSNDGTVVCGLFVDSPARVTFDLGFTDSRDAVITVDSPNAVIYTLTVLLTLPHSSAVWWARATFLQSGLSAISRAAGVTAKPTTYARLYAAVPRSAVRLIRSISTSTTWTTSRTSP